jgi:hypothetical protein
VLLDANVCCRKEFDWWWWWKKRVAKRETRRRKLKKFQKVTRHYRRTKARLLVLTTIFDVHLLKKEVLPKYDMLGSSK